jgi:hypothetical protein
MHDVAIMNARTQITLDPETQRRAQAKAAELDISFAEYVRRLLAQDLRRPRREASVTMTFDLGASEAPTDVARDKHSMIDEAVWEDHVRRSTRRVIRSRSSKASRRRPLSLIHPSGLLRSIAAILIMKSPRVYKQRFRSDLDRPRAGGDVAPCEQQD